MAILSALAAPPAALCRPSQAINVVFVETGKKLAAHEGDFRKLFELPAGVAIVPFDRGKARPYRGTALYLSQEPTSVTGKYLALGQPRGGGKPSPERSAKLADDVEKEVLVKLQFKLATWPRGARSERLLDAGDVYSFHANFEYSTIARAGAPPSVSVTFFDRAGRPIALGRSPTVQTTIVRTRFEPMPDQELVQLATTRALVNLKRRLVAGKSGRRLFVLSEDDIEKAKRAESLLRRMIGRGGLTAKQVRFAFMNGRDPSVEMVLPESTQQFVEFRKQGIARLEQERVDLLEQRAVATTGVRTRYLDREAERVEGELAKLWGEIARGE